MSITSVKTPCVTRERQVIVSVQLSEFEPEVIAEYMRSIGFQVDGTFSRQLLDELNARLSRRFVSDSGDEPEYEEGVFILRSELDRLDTLALCGQRDVAHERLIELVRSQCPGSHL